MAKEFRNLEDNILQQFNDLAGLPTFEQYNKDRKKTIVSNDTYIKMIHIAESYMNIARKKYPSCNICWAFDVIHRYFKTN